jgi:hypothetical protein
VDSTDVRRALDDSLTLLTAPAETPSAWSAQAGVVEWTCLRTAEHIAHDLTAYAIQFAARAQDRYLPLDLMVRPATDPRTVLQITASCARLLCLELDAAAPDATAWHWGPTDRTGFAALAVNEILMHTWDIAQGLHLEWAPPADLAARVLSRLFPSVLPVPGEDAGSTLLWATGRIALPNHPRRESWILKAARS